MSPSSMDSGLVTFPVAEVKTYDRVRFHDKEVISANMCRDHGPGGSHTCFLDKHKRDDPHRCLCTVTWITPRTPDE